MVLLFPHVVQSAEERVWEISLSWYASSKFTSRWGVSSTDIFTIETSGTLSNIMHFDGKDWSEMESASGKYVFSDLVGTSASDVYAVGRIPASGHDDPVGVVLHYDGDTWSEQLTNPDSSFKSVWISPSGVIYVVDSSMVYTFDGNALREMNLKEGLAKISAQKTGEHPIRISMLGVYYGMARRSHSQSGKSKFIANVRARFEIIIS